MAVPSVLSSRHVITDEDAPRDSFGAYRHTHTQVIKSSILFCLLIGHERVCLSYIYGQSEREPREEKNNKSINCGRERETEREYDDDDDDDNGVAAARKKNPLNKDEKEKRSHLIKYKLSSLCSPWQLSFCG